MTMEKRYMTLRERMADPEDRERILGKARRAMGWWFDNVPPVLDAALHVMADLPPEGEDALVLFPCRVPGKNGEMTTAAAIYRVEDVLKLKEQIKIPLWDTLSKQAYTGELMETLEEMTPERRREVYDMGDGRVLESLRWDRVKDPLGVLSDADLAPALLAWSMEHWPHGEDVELPLLIEPQDPAGDITPQSLCAEILRYFVLHRFALLFQAECSLEKLRRIFDTFGTGKDDRYAT